MKNVCGFGLGALLLLNGPWLAAPAGAIELTGAWATNADVCNKVFTRKGKQLEFSQLADLYGSGFIIENDRIRGKAARCTIKSRKEEGATTVHLLAACATDIMLSSVQFSVNVINDDSISRTFPGMPGMEITYYRCKP
jgi:hypothetical protein